MANRTRKNGIYFMLSDDELEILNKKYKLSGCKTLRQFIMKCLFEKDIFVLDMKVFKDMSTNIGRITSNDLKKLLEKQGKDIYFLRKKLYELGNFRTSDTEEI